MKTTVQNKLTTAKNHLVRNRGRYGFVAGLLAGSYVTVAVVQNAEIVANELVETLESIETTS